MEQDEDDMYGTAVPAHAPTNGMNGTRPTNARAPVAALNEADDDEEEEDKEDDSDSDIDIITERAPGTALDPSTQRPKPSEPVRITHDRTASESQKPSQQQRRPSARAESTAAQAELKPGTDFPEVRLSDVDVDAEPTYEPVGKPITGVNIDADLAEQEKPWRRPGSDQSDFFNYGFDEFTWTAYCLKQGKVRAEIDAQKSEQAQFETMFGGGGGMPGMPGMPGMGGAGAGTGAGAGGMAGMPGMPDMNPEMMNQMMQQMMASGQDPSRMDFGTFMQQMGGPMPGGFPPSGPSGMDGGGGGQQGRNQGNFGGGNRGRRGRW